MPNPALAHRSTSLAMLGLAVALGTLGLSCSGLRCSLRAHSSHGTDLPAVEPTPSGWPLLMTIDGMKVYAKGEGTGAPILLLHELPGLTPEAVRFADSLAARGYRVYLPLFFGRFGHRVGPLRTLAVCAGPNFNCLSAKESRIVRKLTRLRDHIASVPGGDPMAIIGMCLTGGLPVALADSHVAAIVLSQPSTPFPFTRAGRASLGVRPEAVTALQTSQATPTLAIRFAQDCLAQSARFHALEDLDHVQLHVVPTADPRAHSVLTVEGQHDHGDSVAAEAARALALTYAFLDEHLRQKAGRTQP